MFKMLASLAALLLLACSGAEATGGIAVIGGFDNNYYLSSYEFQADTSTPWVVEQQKLQIPRSGPAAVSYDGMLYAIAGVAHYNLPAYTKTQLDSVEILNTSPGGGGWTDGPSLKKKRENCAAETLNGVIYVIGGFSDYDILDSVEMLVASDSAATWSYGPALKTGRAIAAAVGVGDKLFVIGGSPGPLATVEILDTSKSPLEAWSSGPVLKTGRQGHAASAHNGIIYVTGGIDATYGLASYMEKLDTSNLGAGWKQGPQFATPRNLHATAFSGGMLCAMGGYDNGMGVKGYTLTSVEMLDVSNPNAQWTLGLPSKGRRQSAAAVAMTARLPNAGDCKGTWSVCTAACEKASERTFSETKAKSGTGRSCPTTVDCLPGIGTCPATVHTDCAGNWICDGSCVAKFNEVTAQSGNGAPCPTQHTCFSVDCPQSEISATLGILTAPMQIVGEYITVPDAGNPTEQTKTKVGAVFTVYAASDTTVKVECEVRMVDDRSDSFHIWFDDVPASYAFKAGTLTSFTWVLVPESFTISAGTHTFHIGVREEGAQLKTLRIISGDAVFRPTDKGDGNDGNDTPVDPPGGCRKLLKPMNTVGSASNECLNGVEGDVCSYACEKGYSNNGYESRTCGLGEWSGKNLVCTSMPCPLVPVPAGGAGLICADKVQGDTCTYTCLNGFTPSQGGLNPRQCDEGAWGGSALTCTETGKCPELSAPIGAVAQKCTAKITDETCTFTCGAGYQSATSTRTCQSDSSWDGGEFQCMPLACPDLTAPDNAVVASCTTKVHKDTCTFACNTGFSDNSFSLRTCVNGKWSDQDLVCAPKPCPDLSFPSNALAGSVACSGKVESETCTFGCQTGFNSAGDATRTCEAGAWTGFSLVCTAEEYAYTASAWTACDAACGAQSTQTRTVDCVKDNVVVDFAKCADLHPEVTEKTCNAEPCVTYAWVSGAWGDCGAPCNGAVQTRGVTCEATEDGPSVSVAVELCTDSGAKPLTSQTCNTEPCVANHWILGEWTACSAECDGGVQTRVVGCRDSQGNALENTKCKAEDTPNSQQDCNTHSCSTTSYTWTICDWDACTAICGGAGLEGGLMAGILNRNVYCSDGNGARVPSAACAEAGAEPITTSIGCKPAACTDHNWMTTAWSKCTNGVRKRTRHCHAPDGTNVADDDCDPTNGPGLIDTLCTPGMCSTFVDVTQGTESINLGTATTAWPAAIIVLAATLSVLLELV